MIVGKNIARLRAQRGWSQDELAEKLGVSRQSISKWETDASTPELEKLMRLADLFGITLDALVRGEAAEAREPAPEASPAPPTPNRKRTAGMILLGIGAAVFLLLLLLGGGFAGLLFASPFLLCALICFTVRRHTGLWCGWAAFLCIDLYLRYGTGLTWNTVWMTLRWTPEMNYVRLAIAWGQFLGMLLLLVYTLRAYRGQAMALTKRSLTLLGGGWAVYLAILPLMHRFLLTPLRGHTPQLIDETSMTVWFLLNTLYDYLQIALLILLLHHTIAAVCAWREQRVSEP